MISKFSVNKPYTVLVGVILIIVLGVVSLTRMVTDLLPNMSFPYVLIVTTDPGASPEEVEKDVTAPIEAVMATTTGIRDITSNSNNSYSMVILEYEQSINMDSCIIEVQQALDQVKSGFKDTIGSPIIIKINPNMLPVMAVAISYEGMDERELKLYVENELSPALESIEGVAEVNVSAAVGDEIINITLDEDKIQSLNDKLALEIEKKFQDAKDEISSGQSQIDSARNQMNSGQRELTNAINEVVSNRDELYRNREDLNGQLTELQTQKESLKTLQKSIKDFISSEDYAGLTQAKENLDKLSAVPENQLTPELLAQKNMLEKTLSEANATISKQFESLSVMGLSVNTFQDLPVALEGVSSTLVQINEGIAAINQGLSQVDQGEISLNIALETLNRNASLTALQMGISSGQMAEAAAGLNTAESEIAKAEESAKQGADLKEILSLDTISGLLIAQNFDMPAGYVMDGDKRYLVRVTNPVEELSEFKDLVLMDMGFDEVGVIRLSDVANVELTDDGTDKYATVNGSPGILISMQKQTGYSTGESAKNLKEAFERIERNTPGLKISILMDQSVYIDIIVKNVINNIIFGAILACIVLFAFLRSFKSTIIIALSIPLSVIFAVMLMYFTGITLNIISLSGLALGIGMLVDNSIVAVENIYRLRAQGYGVKEAAVRGVNEIAGAIAASTLTTVSVYAPIIFTEGITRQMFVDLALTILFTLVASLIVAVTLVPAMAGSLLKKSVADKIREKGRFMAGYEKALRFFLSHKILAFAIALAMLFLSGFGAVSRGLDFMDMDVEANQITGSITAPEGKVYDFETMTDRADQFVEAISGVEGIETIGAMAGGSGVMGSMSQRSGSGTSISLYIVLSEDSKRTTKEITKELEELSKDIDATIEFTTSSMDYTAMFSSGLSTEIRGRNMDTLRELAGQVAGVMEDTEEINEVDDGLSDSEPEFRITVDREKAAKYKMTVAQVFSLVMNKLASTTSATTITMDPREYEVFVRTEEQKDAVLKDIKNLTFDFTNSDGDTETISLKEIADYERTETLSTIRRQNQSRVINVSGTLEEGANAVLVSNKIQEKINALDIPEGYTVKMTGEDETIKDAMKNLLYMMGLAVVFIYLIMVAQFQSLRSPFIIMFTIPLAFTGGFLALLISGITLNVIAMLGFIMLAGLIVNNGIVLIDYINRQRNDGVEKREAIVTAGMVRLRPVLMTVLTTALSVVTIALGIGEGASMMQPMAVVLIGGLLYGTLLTLFVVPCIYDAFHRK